MSGKVVEILIEDKDSEGKPFLCGTTHEGTQFIEGKPYTSVGFSASHYGSGSPCLNDEEIAQSILRCQEWIRKEGDYPKVVDKRERFTLAQYMK
jgi:hypothetical protein